MQKHILPCLAVLALFVTVSSAPAQTPASSAARISNPIRVQVTASFFVPGGSDDSEQAMKTAEDAHKKIYDMAGRECELLQATIASECRLENVSVNVNRQRSYPQHDGMTATGSMSFRIYPK